MAASIIQGFFCQQNCSMCQEKMQKACNSLFCIKCIVCTTCSALTLVTVHAGQSLPFSIGGGAQSIVVFYFQESSLMVRGLRISPSIGKSEMRRLEKKKTSLILNILYLSPNEELGRNKSAYCDGL